jgi:hypothetical protein
VESILLEMLATVTLGAWIAVDLVQEARCRRMDRPGVGPGSSPPPSRPTRRLTNCYPLAKDRDLNAIYQIDENGNCPGTTLGDL